MGEDAHEFSTSADNTATVDDEDDEDDMLGGGGGGAAHITHNGNNDGDMMGDFEDFESSFPAVDTSNEAVAPGGTITSSALPYRSTDENDDTAEPESIRLWRTRRAEQLAHRDELSASKKAETVKLAHEAVDEFYEHYNNRRDKQVAQTRKEAEEFLSKREDTTSGGTSWERIAKLVDLSGKGGAGGSGEGKARMRELLVSLRKDEKAPGATGY